MKQSARNFPLDWLVLLMVDFDFVGCDMSRTARIQKKVVAFVAAGKCQRCACVMKEKDGEQFASGKSGNCKECDGAVKAIFKSKDKREGAAWLLNEIREGRRLSRHEIYKIKREIRFEQLTSAGAKEAS